MRQFAHFTRVPILPFALNVTAPNQAQELVYS